MGILVENSAVAVSEITGSPTLLITWEKIYKSLDGKQVNEINQDQILNTDRPQSRCLLKQKTCIDVTKSTNPVFCPKNGFTHFDYYLHA